MAKRKAEFEIRGDASKLASDLRRASDKIRSAMTKSAAQAESAWTKAGRNISRAFRKAGNTVNGVFSKLRKAFTKPLNLIVGAVGTGAAIKKLSDLAETRKRVENVAGVVAGGRFAGLDEIRYATDLADKFGIALDEVRDGYIKLLAAAKPSGFAIEETRKIFEGATIASTAMGLSAADTNGVFKAFQQIMSKGTVQADELRNQLGERLPGAFQIAAKAMEVTDVQLNKMLETGSLLARDFLPRFAQELSVTFGDAALKNATLWTREFQRIKNELGEILGYASQPIFEAFSGPMRELRDLLRETFAIDKVKQWGMQVGEVIKDFYETLKQRLGDDPWQYIQNTAQVAWIKIARMGYENMLNMFSLMRLAFQQTLVQMTSDFAVKVRSWLSILSPILGSGNTLFKKIAQDGSLADAALKALDGTTNRVNDSQKDFIESLREGQKQARELGDQFETAMRGAASITNDTVNIFDDLGASIDRAKNKVRELWDEFVTARTEAAAAAAAISVSLAPPGVASGLQFANALRNDINSGIQGQGLSGAELMQMEYDVLEQRQREAEAAAKRAASAAESAAKKAAQEAERKWEEQKNAAEGFFMATRTQAERLELDLNKLFELAGTGVFEKLGYDVEQIAERRRMAAEEGSNAWEGAIDTLRSAFHELINGNIEDWDRFILNIATSLSTNWFDGFFQNFSDNLNLNNTNGFWSNIISAFAGSFEGGGFTGAGGRTGGIDGRGGFPAILHPNETVVDHVKGGMAGGGFHQTVNIQPGVSHEMIPQILSAARDGTLTALREQGRRGGKRARQLGF
jgi:tape measure domain-containing protein